MTELPKTCVAHAGIDARLNSICHKVESLEKLFTVRFDAINEAIIVAKEEMDRRLEGMNEFRTQLSMQAATFISKREVELLFDKFDERLRNIEAVSSESRGSKQWTDYIITILVTMASFLIMRYIWKF
jgi:hypothetical protein